MRAGPRPATSVVLFTRDLRVADNPALTRASAEGPVLALFVLDDRVLRAGTTGPNRLSFLLESLSELRSSLRRLGADLYVRRGDPASVAVAAARGCGARTVHLAADVTTTAARRRAELARLAAPAGVEVLEHPGVAVVDPGALRPTGGGSHYRVFGPYERAWTAAARRALLGPPGTLEAPDGLEPGEIPDLASLVAGADPVGRRRFAPLSPRDPSPGRARGGETEAARRLASFSGRDGYAARADLLGEAATTRLGAYLHFGCVSPLAVERWALEDGGGDGPEALVRQLCWRDFFLAVTRAVPSVSRVDYRPRPVSWRSDAEELAAWADGRTGVELVDAGMRQLLAEGFLPNRARLVASSYLVKTLRHDWREGAAHFLYWLTDGDVPSNSLNWQWMAGTGNDTRPGRVLNPERQARRWDPDRSYRALHLGTGGTPPRLPWG
ncbi:MAG: deoxyribodipyrimidine photo-lyase [Actinomycetota bacterium]|nr:deoxyribodipyrimidine photo-lyase [Actinomycetota bacterium]